MVLTNQEGRGDSAAQIMRVGKQGAEAAEGEGIGVGEGDVSY